MTCCVRILTTETLDSSPSILLVSSDGNKTLINCGEGCQRSILEFGQKVSTINRVCLTHMSHDTIGGLPGMILTTADVATAAIESAKLAASMKINNNNNNTETTTAVTTTNSVTATKDLLPGLDLIGPRGTQQFIKSLRHFMRRDKFELRVKEGNYCQNVSMNNNNGEPKQGRKKGRKKGQNVSESFHLQSIVTFQKRQQKQRRQPPQQQYDETNLVWNNSNNNNNPNESNNFPIEAQRTIHAKKRQRSENNNNKNNTGNMDASTSTTTTTAITTTFEIENDRQEEEQQILSFLFTTPPILGKFRADKAMKLGIPKGPLYGQLKSGKDVTFIHKLTGEEKSVKSIDVVEPGNPGIVVAILCYPSYTILEQLQSSDKITKFYNNNNDNLNSNSNSILKKEEGEKKTPKLELIVHMTSNTIFKSSICRKWIEENFDSTVEHIFLNTNLSLKHYEDDENNKIMSYQDLYKQSTPFRSASIGAYSRSLLSNSVYRCPILYSSSRNLKKKHDEETMKEINYDEKITTKNDDDEDDDPMLTDEVDDCTIMNKVVEAQPLMEYVVIPRSKKGFSNEISSTISFDNWKILQTEAETMVQTSGAACLAKTILRNNEDLIMTTSNGGDGSGDDSHGHGELLFTGTGSALPCKHRNVSGIYLKMNNGNAMLLDVGEGTTGQLLRAKHGEDYNKTLLEIKAVWISHPHADHHLGILRLLSERQKIINSINKKDEEKSDNITTTTKAISIESSSPVLIIAPITILRFLQEYTIIDPIIEGSYTFIDCNDITPNNIISRQKQKNLFLMQQLEQELGITSITAVKVTHCPYAFAVIINGTSFGCLAYSGDCRPSMSFARYARHADLLIHEATFEDGMEAEASIKRHCTVGEALDVAKNMNAKAVVLTHFSQRYPKVPPISSINASNDFNNNNSDGRSEKLDSNVAPTDVPIIFAFDFTSITPMNLRAASVLSPALQLLYPDENGEDDDDDGDDNEKREERPIHPSSSSAAATALAIPGLFAQKELL